MMRAVRIELGGSLIWSGVNGADFWAHILHTRNKEDALGFWWVRVRNRGEENISFIATRIESGINLSAKVNGSFLALER